MNPLNHAKRVIDESIKALEILKSEFPKDFDKIVDLILTLKGKVILSGIGKSSYIAKKIAASFASTGTAAFFIHPAEASHGDLGMITNQDLLIMLSKSGETKELFDIINYCKRFDIKIVAITANKKSTLGDNGDYLLLIPNLPEASLITAPTTSSLLMLAIGDALTVSVQESKGFSKDDFFIYHPGGKIGSNLIKVKDLMRPLDELPLVYEDTKFTDTILIITQKNLGCAFIITSDMMLQGIITDGDLRRHLDHRINTKLAKDVMTRLTVSIDKESLISTALRIMNEKSVTILPVLEKQKLVGAIHIHHISNYLLTK